jgi:hypothetical protein
MLSKSINSFKKNQETTLMKKVSKLNPTQQQEALKIKSAFLAFMKSEGDTFEYKSEDGWETITNDYFINGILLPDRFATFVRNMSLVYLIVEMEVFLKEVLEITLKQKPEIMQACQKSLNFEDLTSCENIEKAKQELIDKEIYEVINKGIVDTGKYFNKVICINIQAHVDWKLFIERFYRRNILVHNQGVPNKEYRKATGYNGKSTYLKVTEKYLSETIGLFDSMASLTVEELRKKFL